MTGKAVLLHGIKNGVELVTVGRVAVTGRAF